MTALLEAKNISKYFGGLKAIDDVSMQIEKGSIFGIIGPNGAGKTTFFNVCTGVFKPTKGEIWLDGENLTGMSPEQVAKRGMARTFQNIMLFKYMSVLENIKVGFHLESKTTMLNAMLRDKVYRSDEAFAEEKGQEILELVGLSKYRDMMAGNLPYGMQRRVEIARALATDPKILLLDEPVAGMNRQETMELMELIKDLNMKGYTVVVIEHDMKFVMNVCHRVLVVNFGKKICEGTPEEVVNNKEVGEAYFGTDFDVSEVIDNA